MKRISHLTRGLYTILLSVVLLQPAAAEGYDALAYMDSVEFSLITCSPHEEVYSLYGHTALRFKDLHQGKREDVVFNWGVFDYNKPHFVARFVLGMTDYELGLAPMMPFLRYYYRWGSSVTEQVLNLTAEEKLALNMALEENYLEENRVYRYNYFYDNCSTRPRDIIERSINGKVVYNPQPDYEPSFREMIGEKTHNHPWATWGNNMLLGVKADLATSRQEQEFLPDRLMADFSRAQINGSDGSWRPLVKEERLLVAPGVQVIERDFVLTPMECFVLLLALSVVLFVAEWKRRKTFKYWDATLMVVTGTAGCLLFIMIFSQHPTTSLNLQLLLVNPIHLAFLPAVLRRRHTRYWRLLAVMTVLFLAGAFFQHYAEGMLILALCLLLRFWIHYRNEK